MTTLLRDVTIVTDDAGTKEKREGSTTTMYHTRGEIVLLCMCYMESALHAMYHRQVESCTTTYVQHSTCTRFTMIGTMG